ncbi:MAG: lycopene cyclase domain-containing protein [Verrucomicrobiota bacterium]
MTYINFHAIFNFPLLFLLAVLSFWVAPWLAGEWIALAVVLAVVMVFTTPWDNAAAKWGIWGFPRDRVLAWLGYLPIEEYAFFLLQSLNVVLLTRWLLWQFDWRTQTVSGWEEMNLPVAGAIAVLWAVLWLVVVLRRPPARFHYAIHLLLWFLPVVALLAAVAPGVVAAHAGLLALVTLVAGTYYTLADVVAVREGTWFFDEKQITGYKLGGILPWEEAAFFYLTSLLVAQSYLLLLPPEAR